MQKLLSRKSTIICFLLPAVLIYTVSVILPIIWSGYYSLFNWNGFGAMKFIGLRNFERMCTDSEMWAAVIRTFVFSVWQIFLQVGGGLALAVLLTKMGKVNKVFRTLYYLPVIISSVALCQMFKKIFAVTPIGLFNELLSIINPAWASLEWLSNPNTSLGMVIMTTAYKNMPIYMLIFYSAFLTVPASLVEAATIDGANSWQTFYHIELPHIAPTIFTNVILVLNGSLRTYDIPYLLTNGGPIGSSQTQALYMYKQAFTSQKYGYGSAIAVFIVIESLILALIVRGFEWRSRKEGGIKS